MSAHGRSGGERGHGQRLQRRADVIVQKSLAGGFGLTVAEAMWKARPVLASRVGGIQDQITGDPMLTIRAAAHL